MIVSLWNAIEKPASTTGVWTFVSGPVGGPAAPNTYNGTIDFTSAPTGTYVYRYTVTTSCSSAQHTSDITVNVTSAPAKTNDVCLGSIQIPYSAITGTGGLLSLDSRGDCVTSATPTLSSVSLPPNWPNTVNNDLWYVVSLPSTGELYTVEFNINSSSYPLEGHLNPLVAVYKGSCSSLTLVNSAVGTSNNAFTTVNINSTPGNTLVYIRVASANGALGLFDIDLVAVANSVDQTGPDCCGQTQEFVTTFAPYSYVLNVVSCDVQPTVTRTGTYNEIYNTNYAEFCRPATTTIRGLGIDTDLNGDVYITFEGAGLLGNSNNDNFNMPSIELITSAELSMPGSPLTVHTDTYPITEVLQIGDSLNPSLQLRIQGLNSFEVFYLIFKW